MPAQQAFLPRTLEAERLPSGNALLQGTYQLASIVGPPLAGVVIAVSTTGVAFAVDATSFVLAADRHRDDRPAGPGRPRRDGRPGATDAEAAAAPAEAARRRPRVVPDRDRRAGSATSSRTRALRADDAASRSCSTSRSTGRSLVGHAVARRPALRGRARRASACWRRLWAAGALIGVIVAGSIRLERQGRILLARRRRVRVSRDRSSGCCRRCRRSWSPSPLMGVAIGYANIVAISWIQARVDHGDDRPGHEPRDAHGRRDHAAVARRVGRPASTSTRRRCSSGRGC